MSLTVQRVDPQAVADPIKSLFIANDNPGAALWFGRTFGPATPRGASAWISTEKEGRIVAHVAVLPMRVLHEGRELSGAVFCNLMADKEHRTFYPILAVVKRAVKDLRSAGLDFLMTNPSNPGAVAVMKGAGVTLVATHNRFVCPLGDPRLGVDLLAWAHLQARRLTAPRVKVRQVPPAVAAEWTVRNVARVATVTALRSPEQYAQRHHGFGSPDDLGFILRDSRGREVGAAIVRLDRAEASAGLITLRCSAASLIPGSVVALGLALRAHGVRRLSALAVEGSSFARGLLRGGAIARNEPWAIVGVGFTVPGRAAMAAIRDSDIERVDLD